MIKKIAEDSFRSVFRSIDKNVLHWFPGHMGKGLKQMQTKLRSVDCVIEVHDARIPFSGRNTDFKYTVSGVKPHILVLNKKDLIESKFNDLITKRLSSEYEHVIFTNCKDPNCSGLKKVFPLTQQLINNSNRYNRMQEDSYNVMIIGVPNVGKSSLINALRARHLNKGKATPVGAKPGITRSVLNKIKMCDKPAFYMLDTPGILTPSVPNIETGLKLALCATIQDHLVGETIIADYLLFWLNRNKHYQYVDYFKLNEANDNILEVLSHICKTHNKMLKIRNQMNEYVIKPNFEIAANIMLKSFREGNLGKFMLDEDLFAEKQTNQSTAVN